MDVGERYVLGRLIGEGATACVYEAEDTTLRREVAVKVFRDADIGDSASERIDEEVRILASLAHPHLLPVYDSGRDAGGHRFIVMPLVRGTTLAKRVADGPLAPGEVKRIGQALADALSHIHARGIVHRDVKPSNVLLASDGTPYLADFGFAHAVDGPALTATGCIVGTAGYLAPEQAEGLPLTRSVDVYALGLVLLEALTAERAYRGTPLERATANALRPPSIPARLGPGWARVLRAMTALTPSARPAADEVGSLLEAGEDSLPAVTPSADTMEFPVGDPWGILRSAVPVSATASVAVLSPAAPTRAGGRTTGRTSGRPRGQRRPAALGAAAFAAAAVAVVGLGVDWLSAGTAADPRTPVLTTPGVGATGSTPAPLPGPGAAPAAVTHQGGPTGPASSAHRPAGQASPKCQAGDGRKGDGNGHGGHKCSETGGDADH